MTRRRSLWAFVIDNSILLVGGALLGLAWANLAPHSYERVAHALHFAVDDVGMVFFFQRGLYPQLCLSTYSLSAAIDDRHPRPTTS